jgi:hypothetical protein
MLADGDEDEDASGAEEHVRRLAGRSPLRSRSASSTDRR